MNFDMLGFALQDLLLANHVFEDELVAIEANAFREPVLEELEPIVCVESLIPQLHLQFPDVLPLREARLREPIWVLELVEADDGLHAVDRRQEAVQLGYHPCALKCALSNFALYVLAIGEGLLGKGLLPFAAGADEDVVD